MSQNFTATGCPIPVKLPEDPVPLFSSGNINFKAHDVGWIIAGVFSIIGIIASFWLINKHLSFFYSPAQQRHIVRILLMVPIYAVASFLSYFYYADALYFQLCRDCYEAIVIASFFSLLVSYLSSPQPTIEVPIPPPYKTQEERNIALAETVKDLHLEHWMFPFGWVKWRAAGGGKGEGRAFLWYMRIGIGQYVILRPLSTLISVISQAMGDYCLASWSPKFLHIYMSILVSISVSIAMYCVLQLYMAFKKELAPYQPMMKFLAVKSVVFLTFWQESALGVLRTIGVIKVHTYWSAEEIVIGLSALLSCFEMMVFGLVHIKAFTYLPYRALATPVREPEPFLPPTLPKSFTAWASLEEEAKRHRIEQARLAKMHAFDDEGRPMRKPDGTPVLQQTRKWPALLKCILLTDVGRELGHQTGYIVGKGAHRKPLVDRRAGDLEAAFGRRRELPTKDRGEKYGEEDSDDDFDDGDESSAMVRPSWLQDGRTPPSIGRDGRVVDPTNRGRIVTNPTPDSNRREPSAAPFKNLAQVETLACDQESLLPRTSDDREPPRAENNAWWGSLRGRFWAQPENHHEPDPEPDVQELQRCPPTRAVFTPARPHQLEAHASSRQHPAQFQPPPPPVPSPSPNLEIPTLSSHRTLEIAPPHRLASGAPPFPPSSHPRQSQPSGRALRSRPFSLPASDASSPFSDGHSVFSGAGQGTRHPALRGVGRQPLSPPPRASKHRERYIDYVPPSRSSPTSFPMERDRHIELQHKRSRILPPGAAPSAVGGNGRPSTSGSRTTSFIFEEY